MLVLLLWSSTNSCKKNGADPGCRDIGEPNSMTGWKEVYEGNYVAQPDFNPDNPNEFLFVHQPHGSSNQLYKYNIATRQLTPIFTGTAMVYRSRYGRNGWILLNLADGNIWKIKDNGDSLTQLTFTGNCFHPHWNYWYDRIGYETNNNGYYYGVMINRSGNYIDTVRYGWSETSTWLSPNYIVHAGFKVSTYKIASKEYSIINDFETPGSGMAYGVAILKDDNSVIWSYREGIFETKIDSRKTRSLYPSCNSRRFYDASYAPATHKLLWQRLDYRPVNDSSLLYIKSSIIMMNADGTGEEKIDIPIPG